MKLLLAGQKNLSKSADKYGSLLGGEAEVQDVPEIETANSVAGQFTNCAKRECKNETGLDEDKGVFAIVQALNYIRHSNSKDVGPLQQWHFSRAS